MAQAMDGENENMVTVMKRIQREGKIPFSDADVRCEISTIRGAGHETSSNTLSWALYLLAQSKHKAFLHKLQKEVDQVLGTQHTCSFDQVPLLSYTRWVIYETLRLFPTVPSFPVMNGGLLLFSIITLNCLSAPGRCGLRGWWVPHPEGNPCCSVPATYEHGLKGVGKGRCRFQVPGHQVVVVVLNPIQQNVETMY